MSLRAEKVFQAYATTGSMQQAGRKFGLTRQRAHQLIASVDPDGTRRAEVIASKPNTRVAQELRELAFAIQQARPCRVCGYWSVRGRLTCSQECARAWSTLRQAVHRDKYRQQVARAITRHPENYTPARVAWAHRILSGARTRPYQRQAVSKVARLTERYRATQPPQRRSVG